MIKQYIPYPPWKLKSLIKETQLIENMENNVTIKIIKVICQMVYLNQ